MATTKRPAIINGVAHTILTVSNWEKAYPYYKKLLNFFGLTCVFDPGIDHKGQDYLYFVGGRTAIGITRADNTYANSRFIQRRVGLHHVCWRVRSREAVDSIHRFLVDELNATIVHEPKEGNFAPGYYSVLWEDPDGIRLEVNFVPGKGLLAFREPKMFAKASAPKL
mmetsp:Transcript_20582/g.22852  ORF Transcript_20582/g.22852 Transcript_20582/m.22852 type:complete len:167 (-) Transcript_20582:157-657(-)